MGAIILIFECQEPLLLLLLLLIELLAVEYDVSCRK